MADEGVVPVREIESPIGAKSGVDDAERGVGGLDERRKAFDFESGTGFGESEAFDGVLEVTAGDAFTLVGFGPVGVFDDVRAPELSSLLPQ